MILYSIPVPGVFSLKFRVLFCTVIVAACVLGQPAADAPDPVLDHYAAATKQQEKSLEGASMDVDIDASLPKLQKHGKLHALRRILPLGLIKYEKALFEGDNVVNKEVISRYLSAEVEAQKNRSPAFAVTPDNYKFKSKGMVQLEGRDTYIYQVTPKQKRERLFKGDIWIDARTFLKVQESGYLVKNPSIWLKRVAFVRKYEIRDGVSVPKATQSVADTRLVGKAEMTIEFSNVALDPKRLTAAEDAQH
jgi:hypothetical protein